MVNKHIIVGRVGKDPEIRQLEQNQLAKFSIASSESYRNKAGEKVEETEWFNIVIWGKLAGIVEQYVRRGSLLYLEGKVKTRSYEDQDGNKKYVTETVCHTMQMLGGKPQEQNQTAPAAQPGFKGYDKFDPSAHDDLPF